MDKIVIQLNIFIKLKKHLQINSQYLRYFIFLLINTKITMIIILHY